MEDKKQDDEKEKKVSEVRCKGFTEEKKPKIRFAGFTDDWQQCKLKDLAEFNPKSVLPDEFEYVDLESVVGTEMISHRTETKETAPLRAQRLAQTGDLFYQTVRPYQKNNYLYEMPEDNYVFSTGYAQMRPYGCGRFLLSLVQTDSFVNTVLEHCTGTSYPAINSNDLSNIEVYSTSDKAEQKQIGDFFKNLDNLITLYQRKCNELKEVKKYMLQKMFPKNGETKPEIRFNGFTGDWEQKKLCEICNYISTNLTVKDIEKNGTVDLYDANGIIGKTTKNVQNRDYITIIKDGAGVGRVRLLSKNTSFISTMGAISTNNNSIEFLYYLISIIDFKKYIKTGTIPHIYFSEYGDEIIQLPSYEEQEKIGKFFYNLDNLISLYQRKCDELKKVKKYMLQNMFPRMS